MKDIDAVEQSDTACAMLRHTRYAAVMLRLFYVRRERVVADDESIDYLLLRARLRYAPEAASALLSVTYR